MAKKIIALIKLFSSACTGIKCIHLLNKWMKAIYEPRWDYSESLFFDANSKYFLLKWHFWGKTMVRIELKFCYHILNLVLITRLGMSESRFWDWFETSKSESWYQVCSQDKTWTASLGVSVPRPEDRKSLPVRSDLTMPNSCTTFCYIDQFLFSITTSIFFQCGHGNSFLQWSDVHKRGIGGIPISKKRNKSHISTCVLWDKNGDRGHA